MFNPSIKDFCSVKSLCTILTHVLIYVMASQQHRQQLVEQERYKQQLVADRQKRIQQQHEQRQKLEDVSLLCTHSSFLLTQLYRAEGEKQK